MTFLTLLVEKCLLTVRTPGTRCIIDAFTLVSVTSVSHQLDCDMKTRDDYFAIRRFLSRLDDPFGDNVLDEFRIVVI